MSAVGPRGRMLGLHFEVDPSELLSGRAWEIELDSEKPTRPGFGVLSYGSRFAPRSVRTGHLTARLKGPRLEATFEAPNDDERSFSSAAIGARYVVECLVADSDPSAAGRPSGSLEGVGAFALRRDEKLESDFCAQFRGL